MKYHVARIVLFGGAGFVYGLLLMAMGILGCTSGYQSVALIILFSSPLGFLILLSSPPLGFLGEWCIIGIPVLWGLIGLLLGMATRRLARWALLVTLAIHYTALLWLLPKFLWQRDFGWVDFQILWALAPDIIVMGLGTYLAGQILVWSRLLRAIKHPNSSEPKRPWWQFRLRTLLLIPVLLSMPLGWLASELRRAREHDRAVAELEKLGVHVYRLYDPTTLEEMLGDRLFRPAVEADFEDAEFADGDLEHLRGLRKLQYLNLGGTAVTDAGLKHLEGLIMLQGVSLNDTQITGAGLVHLKATKKLGYLDVSRTEITDAGLKHLNVLPRLSVLKLANTQVTDTGLTHLKGLRNLAWLNLDNSRVTDRGLIHLEGMSQLRGLDLAGAQVTDAGLRHLEGMPELWVLDLANTQVTDAGLRHLREMSDLRDLNLANTGVTDTGLRHLKTLPMLTELDLADTRVTDAGLRHLREMSELTDLNLANTGVTDAGLEHLKRLPFLWDLNLAGTEVTPEGAKELGRALPDLTIQLCD